MPRRAREKSETGYYHVIVRGVGGQIIFEEDMDCYYFLKLIRDLKNEFDFSVNAYCLMSNHVHLLINDKHDNISVIMHKLGLKYSRYFNAKYEREGHLYQNRFKSLPILNDNQMLATFRYILQNPQKAGLITGLDYPWNCYSEYQKGHDAEGLVDCEIIIGMLGGQKALNDFLHVSEETEVFEAERRITMNDSQARRIAEDICGKGTLGLVKNMEKEHRDGMLAELKDGGLTLRQIERLTGVSRSVIQRA